MDSQTHFTLDTHLTHQSHDEFSKVHNLVHNLD